MMVEPGPFRPLEVFRLAPSGERNQAHPRAPWPLANPGSEFESIEHGHSNVEQHDLRPKQFSLGERVDAVVAHTNFVSNHLQHLRERVSRIAVVVCNQHTASSW